MSGPKPRPESESTFGNQPWHSIIPHSDETPAQRQKRIEEELLESPPLPKTPERLQKEDSGESLGERIDRSSRNRYCIRYRKNNNFSNHS